jgi:DtxR family Mn-dependent transcriptional regulator
MHMPDPLTALIIAGLIGAFLLLLFFPGRGIVPRWQRARHLTERVLIEDALKHIYRCESHNRHPTVQSIAGALNVSTNEVAQILDKMQVSQLVQLEGNEPSLTPNGSDYALRIIRAHRLWERYLAEETGFEEAEWHQQADRFEHILSPDQANLLSTQLGNPTHDPHGDPIPTARGEIQPHGGKPLTSMNPGEILQIVHIEDEPETVYAQLVAERLHPGMEVRISEMSPQRVRFWAGGDEHLLAPVVAANISVLPITKESESYEQEGDKLSNLKLGEQGYVVSISPVLRGAERRRLMDLGIIPGTLITAELRSPSGDPTAYRIRGATIALRHEQADLINISPIQELNP